MKTFDFEVKYQMLSGSLPAHNLEPKPLLQKQGPISVISLNLFPSSLDSLATR